MIVGGTDIETTGFLKPEHRMVELCLQKWKLDTVTFDAELIFNETWRINPERSIPEAAFAVHKISSDDVASAPTWAECSPYILAQWGDVDLAVAHNGNEFDRPFINMECERIKVPTPRFILNPWFDTMLSSRWATTWGKVPTLEELCFACDVPYDGERSHAADYDVTVMMKCFFFGLKRGFFTLPT